MVTFLPTELLAGAMDMVCYFVTAFGVVLSFLFMPRG